MLKAVKLFPEVKVPTPFGEIMLGELALPPIGFPELDDRKKQALSHSLGADLTALPGLIPWVGDILADILKTHHAAEIRQLLTPEERERFRRYTKLNPETIALVRTFLEGEGR